MLGHTGSEPECASQPLYTLVDNYNCMDELVVSFDKYMLYIVRVVNFTAAGIKNLSATEDMQKGVVQTNYQVTHLSNLGSLRF